MTKRRSVTRAQRIERMKKTTTKQNTGAQTFCSRTKDVPTDSLKPHPKNPNQHKADQVTLLAKIIEAQGFRNPIVVSERSGFIVAGHARLAAAQKLGLQSVPVDVQKFETEEAELAHLLADNRIAELAEINNDTLKTVLSELSTSEIDMDLTGFDANALEDLMTQVHVEPDIVDAEPESDRAAELVEKWGVKDEQLWSLGDHRLMCGDSTAPRHLAKLMGGNKAILLHADPPYGMGKEADGVANDNLHRDKLDAFQMEWWKACRPHIEDNGSAYIWGNPEDLWRLWYVGGLGELQDTTIRNELVWNKNCGRGMLSDTFHSYVVSTERCLFIMLGQQFLGSLNKEDYWEGYEPLRVWLVEQADKMGWSKKDVHEITGTQMSSHWLTKSQFMIINRENYAKLKEAAKGAAFVESYDELMDKFPAKREFAARVREKRSPFDNTHDTMHEVWEFERVTGQERQGHATPKPVEMVGRAIKTSAPPGLVVLEPFIGSGSTLMACENTGRRCFGMELIDEWVAVTIERWHQATGKEPELIG